MKPQANKCLSMNVCDVSFGLVAERFYKGQQQRDGNCLP
jgi:hypothetical protein